MKSANPRNDEREDYDEAKALFDQAFHGPGVLTNLEFQAVTQFLLRKKAENTTPEMARTIFENWGAKPNAKLDALMEGGEQAFHRRVLDRLLAAEKSGKRSINRCPRCSRIVRTALAKQCLWCGHDWHQISMDCADFNPDKTTDNTDCTDAKREDRPKT